MTTHGIAPGREHLEAAAAACAFLSNLLLRPEAGEVAAASLSAELIESWPLRRDPDTSQGLELLKQATAHPSAPGDLNEDYRRLYLGPGPALANPFESVHRSDEGLTFDVQTHQVRASYARFGLTAPELNREPDDHIGLELAFVGELAVAAAEALECLDVDAATAVLAGGSAFLSDHLLRWGPAFATLVIEHASTDLHRAVGYLLRGALPQFAASFGPS